jgi:hypothetical protein
VLAGLSFFSVAFAGDALIPRAPEPPTYFLAEIGVGYESQTSPVVRVTPEGTLVRLDGFDRLAGANVHGSTSGMADVQFSPDSHFTVGGDLRFKRAPSASVFDFASVSINPMLRTTLWGAVVGLGRNLQRIDVAGGRFRRVFGTVADLTVADPSGDFWVVLVDRSRNRHVGDLRDLDSTSTQMLFKRHVEKPGFGLDAIEFEIILARERNDQDFHELSSRSALGRIAFDAHILGLDTGLGIARHVSKFDDTAFPGTPRRRDLATTLDASIAWEFQPRNTIKLDYMISKNDANLALFENTYRVVSLGYGIAW